MSHFAICALSLIVCLAGSQTINADQPSNLPIPAKPTAVEYSLDLVRRHVVDAREKGDARRGAMIFSKASCIACHQVGTRGGKVGPQLSNIGACVSPEDIVEAVLWPARTVKPEYKAITVRTSDGKTITGVIHKDEKETITLIDQTSKTHAISKSDIDDRRDAGSLMPDGLMVPLTPEERRDLLRYLFELGKTKGLEGLSHEPAPFTPKNEPLYPEDWVNQAHPVNRDRQYDWYAKEAAQFRYVRPAPLLYPEWPELDGGKYYHWGNQTEATWASDRWSQTDVGSMQAGVFRHGTITVPRAICIRLGEDGGLSACFDPDTLEIRSLWSGGFVGFGNIRAGFMEGLRPLGAMLPTPENKKIVGTFQYHGYYRFGKRVVFSYKIGDTEFLDAPWAENGKFVREIAPADKHSLAHVVKGGKAQWPQVIETVGKLGKGRPYAVDTLTLPAQNPWKSLMYLGGHDFLPDGSVVMCTMQGDVWRAEGVDSSLKSIKWRRIAAGLHQALGLVVHQSEIYVLGRDQITKLHDRNGDGEIDFYECFSKAYTTSPAGHDYICGLERDKEGNFYTTSGVQGVVKISPDGKKAEVIANGLRNPDGIGIMADGAITVPSTEGDWTPASILCEVRPNLGRIPHFGYGGPQKGKPPELPLVYVPRGLDNSSGGPVAVTSDKWGPLQGTTIHLSFGTGNHFLLLRDVVDGQAQAAVVPLPGDFDSGVHRGRFSPADGQLYVSGMNGWGCYTPADGCLQRVRYTGEPVQLPVRYRAYQNGVMLEFSQPIDRSIASRVESQFAQSWNYRYGPGYGSREFSPSHDGMRGHDPVQIKAAHVLGDGKRLFLEIPDIQPVNVLHLNLLVGASRPIDVFATIHKLDTPFREIPGYKDVPKVVAAHPLLKDLARGEKKVPNPWRNLVPGSRDVKIEAGKNLTYGTPTVKVKAGEQLALTFNNPDLAPHNWVLIKPGKLKTIGDLVNQLIADPDAVSRNYVPKHDDVIVYTDIIQPGEKGTIYFKAPMTPGRYPFLCSFPGHWGVMNGELIVE